MYFNFASRSAENWWARREFLNAWWRGNARDRRWIPPRYDLVYQAIVQRSEPFLTGLLPTLLTVEAVSRPAQTGAFGGVSGFPLPAGMGDSIVAQALALTDTRARPATLFLSMLFFANDEETFESMLQAAWERGQAYGVERIVAPAELVPSLSAGLLLDHFHVRPPLHTPYNAPYLPEIVAGAMEPVRRSRLWRLETAERAPRLPLPSGLEIVSFDAMRLAGDLLPLLQIAMISHNAMTLPSAAEADFALRLWSAAPLIGRLALVDGAPVGFALLQPDVGASLRRMRGGRQLWARAALALRPPQRVSEGRLLLAAVQASARGQGIAHHLLVDAQGLAASSGWRSLAIGPVIEESAAAQLLARAGATPHQRYALFAQES